MDNPVIKAAIKSEPVESVEQSSDLVTIGELAAEGHGTVDVLVRELAALVVVNRDAALRLLEERAAVEERRRLQRQRRAEEFARRHPRPPRGVPALDGMTAHESMLAASGEDERKRNRAGERTAALMRGESWGGTFAVREES